MLKYLSKFVLDILPSVAATIIGAYIVNHYVVSKPADPPVAAAASPAEPKKSAVVAEPAKPTTAAEDVAADKPPADQVADKPAETAGAVPETRRHKPALHDKTLAKAAPTIAAPAVAAPAVETAAIPDDHRDANDLARAAIERLRHSSEPPARAAEAPRPTIVAAQPTQAVQPLPPAINVVTPADDRFQRDGGSTASISPGPSTTTASRDDPRLTPPASIPSSLRPLDLRADSAIESPVADRPMREHKTVADDVLSAAKSVFHAVLPH